MRVGVVWTEVPCGVLPLLSWWSVSGYWFCRRLHRGVEFHNGQDQKGTHLPHALFPHMRFTLVAIMNEISKACHWICCLNACIHVFFILTPTECLCWTGSEVPGAGQLHDDGWRSAVHVFQQRHRDAGYGSPGWQNKGLTNVTVKFSAYDLIWRDTEWQMGYRPNI